MASDFKTAAISPALWDCQQNTHLIAQKRKFKWVTVWREQGPGLYLPTGFHVIDAPFCRMQFQLKNQVYSITKKWLHQDRISHLSSWLTVSYLPIILSPIRIVNPNPQIPILVPAKNVREKHGPFFWGLSPSGLGPWKKWEKSGKFTIFLWVTYF